MTPCKVVKELSGQAGETGSGKPGLKMLSSMGGCRQFDPTGPHLGLCPRKGVVILGK